MSGIRKRPRASTRKPQIGRGGGGARAKREAGAASPLVIAFARLIRLNTHYYRCDHAGAVRKTAADMLETNADHCEQMRRRLAQLVGLTAETPLPDVLTRVASIAERNLPSEAETRAAS